MCRGSAINEAAFLSSQSITLREQVREWEKQARKTPPKTLLKEWEKVRQAKVNAELGHKRLQEMTARIIELFPISQWWPNLLLGERK